jgi:hypothetical protein
MVVIGGLLALLATCAFNVVLLIQKFVVSELPPVDRKNLVASYKRIFLHPKYLASFALLILGGWVFIAALKLGGLAVVAPLQNFGLIVLAVGAKRYLGEVLTPAAKGAIGLLVVMPAFIMMADVAGPEAPGSIKEALVWIGWGTVLMIVLGVSTRASRLAWPVLVAAMNVIAQFALQAFTLGFDIDRPFSNLPANLLFLTLTALFAFVGPQLAIPLALKRLSVTVFTPMFATLVTLGTIVGAVVLYGQSIGNVGAYLAGVACGIVAVGVLGRFEHVERGVEEPQAVAADCQTFEPRPRVTEPDSRLGGRWER